MKAYKTPYELIADFRSGQMNRRINAREFMRATNAEFKSCDARTGRVSAAFTFDGVRYVAVHRYTKSGDISKRFRVETLDAFIADRAAWYTRNGLDADEAVKTYMARYAA